jgi:hypothetical protein
MNLAMTANPLIGTWRLVSCETIAADDSVAYPFGREAVGLLVYTEDGSMSVAIMRHDREPFAAGDLLGGSADEKRRAAESYLSYSGRYEVRGDSVVHHVELSLFPNWTGQDQVRAVELSGDRLTLEAPPFLLDGLERRARLIWQRR